MTLEQALSNGKTVVVHFVDCIREKRWSVSFNKHTDLSAFLSDMCEEVEETTDKDAFSKGFDYCKVIYITNMELPEETIWDNDEEDEDESNEPAQA